MSTSGVAERNEFEKALSVDQHGIEPIPESDRDSTSWQQFWIWFGANITPTSWVVGAIGPELGLSLVQSIVLMLVGQAAGHAEQRVAGGRGHGERAGLPAVQRQVDGGEPVRARLQRHQRLPRGQPDLGVELVALERAEHDGGDDAHHHEERRGQHDQPGEQPGAQRQRAPRQRRAPGRELPGPQPLDP